jgi:hypothetical protein
MCAKQLATDCEEKLFITKLHFVTSVININGLFCDVETSGSYDSTYCTKQCRLCGYEQTAVRFLAAVRVDVITVHCHGHLYHQNVITNRH